MQHGREQQGITSINRQSNPHKACITGPALTSMTSNWRCPLLLEAPFASAAASPSSSSPASAFSISGVQLSQIW
jgi:hypothetical protein